MAIKTSTALRVLAVSAVSVLAMSGCAGSGGGETENSGGGETEKVQLTFQQFDPSVQVVGLQAAVDEFNRSQDRIEVTMANIAFADALTTFVREAGAGGGADILHSAFVWTGDLASNGLIVNLDELAAATPTESPVDSFTAKEINTYEGSLYALPWTVDSFALTYNPENLAAAGLDGPPADWDELKMFAAAMSGDGAFGLCIPMAGAPGSEVWHVTNAYLWSHGSAVVRNIGGDWTTGSTEEQLSDAIAYFKSFIQDGSTPQNVLSIPLAGDPIITQGLASGECAMTFQSPQQFTVSLESNEGLLSAPLPSGPEGRFLHMGGRSLSINAQSDYPEESWEFIRYITSKDVFQNYYTNQFPAQSTLLASAEFGPTLSSETFRGYAENLLVAKTYLEYMGAPEPIPAMWNTLVANFNAAYSGQVSPDEAAREINTALTNALGG